MDVAVTAALSGHANHVAAAPVEAIPALGAVETKPAYPPPAATPTQEGPNGIRFDFNQGLRVLLPTRTKSEAAWTVRLFDVDTGNLLFESQNRGAVVTSSKRFYVRFRLEVFDGETRVLSHDLDCRDRDVLIQFPVGTLGDILAWFPYADRFQRDHGCKLTCALSGLIIPLLENAYPNIRFVTHEQMVERRLCDDLYATYSLGLFFDDQDLVWQPTDFRQVGLHRTAGYILGVDPTETPARLHFPDDSRPIEDPYVCIAVQSSSGCKMWNNAAGWREVVLHLKAQGYRVICIDQKPVHGSGLLYTHIPHGAEDETGDRPLAERARWLRHAAPLWVSPAGWRGWPGRPVAPWFSSADSPIRPTSSTRPTGSLTGTPATAAGTTPRSGFNTPISCGVRATRTRRAILNAPA